MAAGLSALLAWGLQAQDGKPLYENNFEKTAPGPLPEDFLVLEGGFEIRTEEGNKFIELPGAPLETFGVLFGPAEKENIRVSARIFGTGKGRRFPTFGIGAGGQGGYRLQVAPAKKAVELYRGESLKATIPFEWQSSKWTQLKLQVRKVKDGAWTAEGKVWMQGDKEPEKWAIKFDDAQEASNGRSGIWGSPFAGTPIRFDDLHVSKISQ
ncbi:MAG: hypothetical protein EXS31_00545 [Pedosphaera sp.]|nr:hypothetical protein [Pedosphaera sp.]